MTEIYMIVKRGTREVAPGYLSFYAGTTREMLERGLHQSLFGGEGVFAEKMASAGLDLVEADKEMQEALTAHYTK